MQNNPKLFLIPKPESAKYLQDIEDILSKDEFILKGIYAIDDWGQLARAIYKQQLDEGTNDFRMAFEGHIRVSQILFGNESVLLTISNPYQDLSEGLETFIQKKQEIRESLAKKGHENLLICANLERISQEIFSDYGVAGTLGVNSERNFYPFEGYMGVWDYFYFKFIHIPDPKLNSLKREWSILLKWGILNNDISKDKWQLMKTLGTLTTPK